MTDDNKPDSTSCDDEMKGDLEIDETVDSVEQSSSSKSAKGSPLHKDDVDVKSPASSNDLKIDESVDDIEEDNVENTTPGKKRGRPPKPGNERKRKARPKDANAPKAPINGYVRFLNEHRERCRRENPEIAFASITKLLAQEWSKLQQEEKQKYLDAAEKDRERYNKELDAYHLTDSYIQFKRQMQEEEAAKKMVAQEIKESEKKRLKAEKMKLTAANTLKPSNKMEEFVPPPVSPPPQLPLPVANIRQNHDNTFDIPIFTEEFLDQNKAREADLRQLRKTNTDLEGQNAVLTKHIDSFKDAIGKLESEAEQHRNSNKQMELYLAKLRGRLVDSFQEINFPGWNGQLCVENIDQYMDGLLNFMKDAPKEEEKSLENIKSIIHKMDCSDL